MTKTITRKIRIPKEVTISIQEGNNVTLKGPKGELSKIFKTHRVKLNNEGNVITLIGVPGNKQTSVLVETIIAHIRNMVEGLIYGYCYQMKLVYSHFPMSIQIDGNSVNIKNFLGEKFPRKAKIVGDTKVEVKGQDINVSGIEKDSVGQTASNLERSSKVKGKDIRRYQDGIYLVNATNITPKKLRENVIEIVRD
ncbi:MAG: 50S ribosomal protein L6 [Candidatus ainarchaeum sp.]|jgi:large subunit ribosomal protein L6|nr:50S ribosomal protein L6 [Candidatus ainarchaeum sp.]MDD3085759.1 50S ribosomal protein L6 [Candidatus ainarchaeum sp.]MDD4128492.1 50S ribosomal protein L6 [Candidatus ainarchaeum sp.]MDD4467970.1 50S ribosomal protein L6 [Candidatus ainarchaeum sp.]HPM85547.1 50S ribosomal protein L6 [archaeon]